MRTNVQMMLCQCSTLSYYVIWTTTAMRPHLSWIWECFNVFVCQTCLLYDNYGTQESETFGKKINIYSSVVRPRMALCDSEVYVVVTDKRCVVSPELTPCPVLCRHCPALESPSAAWTRRRTRTGSRSDRVTVQQLLITMSMCYCMNESEYILFSQPCCTVTFLRLDLMCFSRAGRGSQGD